MPAEDLFYFFLIGFGAQLVDSSLGMGFGTLSSSLLLAYGFPPVSISATIHTAEIFAGGASAVAHYKMGNIDRELLKRLAPAAILGAILGSLLVVYFSAQQLKYYMAFYFVVVGGCYSRQGSEQEYDASSQDQAPCIGIFWRFL